MASWLIRYSFLHSQDACPLSDSRAMKLKSLPAAEDSDQLGVGLEQPGLLEPLFDRPPGTCWDFCMGS